MLDTINSSADAAESRHTFEQVGALFGKHSKAEERVVYDALIASRSGAVCGFVCDAEFWDVGTTADYWRTSQAFIERSAAAHPATGRGTRIDDTARVTRSVLWDDVEVGRDAVVDECIVTDRVTIPEGAEYRRAVIIRGEDDRLLVSPLFPGP